MMLISRGLDALVICSSVGWFFRVLVLWIVVERVLRMDGLMDKKDRVDGLYICELRGYCPSTEDYQTGHSLTILRLHTSFPEMT